MFREKKVGNALQIGVNCFENDRTEQKPCLMLLAEDLDFAVCHIDSVNYTVEEACQKGAELAAAFKESGMDFIANYEFQNFRDDCTGPDGYDWANRPDGTHLLNLPPAYIQALASEGNLAGIMYDELEHVIVNRNLSIELASKWKRKLPAFPLCKSRDTVTQGRLLDRQLKAYADAIKAGGAPALCGEHVFPVLFHRFASAGMTPNFKSQKESFSNIQFAIAVGAALQYGTPLWNCVDLWYRMKTPGHSPQEMVHNLLFAYYAGVDRVYVEHCRRFTEGTENDAALNKYGKAFASFLAEYKDKPRSYTAADYRPEIGIIRFDDSFWGQCDPAAWKPMLFGNKNIRPDARAKEYLKVFHLLTHGESCKNGLSWDRVSPWSLRPHRSFATLNSTAVFDDTVRRKNLESLKLCFLCGYRISKETLADVQTLVRENGLTVVTSKRFAPQDIHSQVHGAYAEIADGCGTWIVVRSFDDTKLKERLAPFLGQKGEIRLTFTNKTVVLKISKDGETFTVKEE